MRLSAVSKFLSREDSEVLGETGIDQRPRAKTLDWINDAEHRIVAYTDLDPEFYDDHRAVNAIETALRRDVDVKIVHKQDADPKIHAPSLDALDREYESLLLLSDEGDSPFITSDSNYLVVDDNFRRADHELHQFGEDGYPAVFFSNISKSNYLAEEITDYIQTRLE